MANITYRLVKGSPLTNQEIDDNFLNIDTEVHEKLNFPTQSGLAVSTNGDESSVARTLQVSGNGISITNGDGVNGDPSIVLASDTNNTPNTVVYRDGQGDFTARTVRANLIAGNVYLDTGEVVEFEGTGGDGFVTKLDVADPTANRIIKLPDIDGTLVTTGDTGTVTNTMLAGSIANNKLANSSITIDGEAVSLGGSVSISSADFYWSGNHEFVDSLLTIRDNTDPTKKVQFQASPIASGSTVTLLLPNENFQTIATMNRVNEKVPLSGGTMTGYLTLNANPTSSLHAATKSYVDSAIAGIPDVIWVGTTSNPAATYGNYNSTAYPAGTVIAMNYNFNESYYYGNGGAVRNVNERRLYLKRSSTGSWVLIASTRL